MDFRGKVSKFRVCMFLAFVTLSLVFAIPLVSAETTPDVTMSLDPRTQSATNGNDVAVKVMLSATTNKRVSYAKVLLGFNPQLLEIKSVTTSNMFCNYPTDSSSYAADNTQGVVMVTGFATGTTACPYPELTTTPTLFVTITFTTKAVGTSNLSFVYTGSNDQQSSSVMDTNSPTQFVLIAPQNGSITVSAPVTVTTTAPVPPSNLGVEASFIPLFAIILLLVLGFLMMKSKSSHNSRVRIGSSSQN